MNNPLVSIQIVVKDGSRYLRHCLDAVMAQSYPSLEILVLDNASTDETADIAQSYPRATLVSSDTNLGMWPGQERLLAQSRGVYVVALSVDVMIGKDFVAQAVAAMEADPTIGALQGKVYQYDIAHFKFEKKLIDTCGFALTRGRKVINIGHGQPDGPAFADQRDILGVEGAVPVFRRSALEVCRVEGMLVDPDYFWYGDDLDLAWRMTILGHRQVFCPTAIAWHDRTTTKGVAHTLGEHLSRRAIRAAIPLFKRRLDWSNVRFTIIKNDYILNLLRDAPYILIREIATLGYSLIYEPGVLAEIGRFLRLLPRMVRRRRALMARATTPARQIHRFFEDSWNQP